MERWVSMPCSLMATFATMLFVVVATVVVCIWLRKRKLHVWERFTQEITKYLPLNKERNESATK